MTADLEKVESPDEPAKAKSHKQWQGYYRFSDRTSICEALVFLFFAIFFLAYGLTPYFGGDGLGLAGADEPRYAQIAHEMLGHFNQADTVKGKLSACVTPYLYGKPWLEKPALYYWRAMFLFQDFGVHDWSARLPSTTFAFIMVALIYLHMRQFRPGGHLDAALITAACVGIIAFSRGASTDMQLAAPLAIGLLGWYAWYETDSKFWLYDIYFFTGLATLAKGPVAPFLAIVIVCAFAVLRRDWSIVRRSFWWPGALLYFAMVLPWFIAVQRQNPTFFREFFLQHNLERFATDRYQHQQPVWYYLVVVVLAMMPWTVIAIRALADGALTSFSEWRQRYSKACKPCSNRPGDAFPEFLVIWAVLPIVFFSLSKSKLPGYILPSLPPIAILTGDFLFRRRQSLSRWILFGHALLSGFMTVVILLLPWFISHGRSVPPTPAIVAALVAGLGATLLILIVTRSFGVAHLRLATCSVLVVLLVFLYGIGPVFGIPGVTASKRVIQLLDRSYSARPLNERIEQLTPPSTTVAVFRVRRDVEYGLSFYRNREVANYESLGVPDGQHVLVARMTGRNGVDLHTTQAIEQYLEGRPYEPLFNWPEQGLEVFLVGPRQ
jgi:4-amino-4-deoxy-L-arabinose transferase-like glycosyltransferase